MLLAKAQVNCTELFNSIAQKTKYLAGIAKHGFSVGVQFLRQRCRVKPYIFLSNNLKFQSYMIIAVQLGNGLVDSIQACN